MILRDPLDEVDQFLYDVRLVRAVEDPIREIVNYIYEGDTLPFWERGVSPRSYENWESFQSDERYSRELTT